MASLYARSNGYYYLSFYSPDRKPARKQVSTGTRVKREAQRVQRRLEDGYRFGTYCPWRDDASAFLRGEDAKGEGAPETLSDAVAAFLASRANLSPATREWYRSHLETAAGEIGEDTPLRDVTTERVQRYIDGKDVKAVTKHGCRRALRALFNWLRAQGAVRESPTPGLRLPRAPQKHPRFLSPADVDKLCETISAHQEKAHVADGTGLWLLPIVRANVYLGLRAGEVVNLRWSDVDLEARRLTVRNTETFTTKAAKERTIPLCAAVAKVLGAVERRGEFVFPNHGGGQLDRQQLSRRFKHFARLAELPEHVNLHTTRHTAASWLAQQGAGIEAIRLYMGHGSIAVTQRYMHLAPDAFASQIGAAFERVGRRASLSGKSRGGRGRQNQRRAPSTTDTTPQATITNSSRTARARASTASSPVMPASTSAAAAASASHGQRRLASSRS